MYKGYKIIKGERFYKIVNSDGMACAVGTMCYLKNKTAKELIDELISRRTPEKPKIKIETVIVGGDAIVETQCFCPVCGCNLGKIFKYHHCPCGQVIDWKEFL